MNKRGVCFVALGLLLSGFGIGWADQGKGKKKGHDHDDDERRAETLFESQIVRASSIGSAQLGPFPTNGTDPLTGGEVEVEDDRKVQIELVGAQQNATYNVFFCRFGFPPSCFGLSPETLTTGPEGKAKARLMIPDSQNNFAGIFVLTRGGSNQFVSGFSLGAAMAQLGVEVEISGKISSLNPSANSFRLENFLPTFPIDFVVNASTEFKKAKNFADLKVGQNVEIKGFASGNTILVNRLKVEDKDDD